MPRAITGFALSGLAAAALIATGGAVALRQLGIDEATRDARQLTELAGRAAIEPSLTDDLLSGDPAARARLDRVVRRRVLVDPVVRVKLWSREGTILYSDEPRLVGTRYRLGEDELESLDSGDVAAEVSSLAGPENRFERNQGKLLEVYLSLSTPSGERVLFETYQRFSSITASGRRIWGTFVPVFLAALLLLAFVQLPLAWSMARRLRQGQEERNALLERAVEASEAERMRIASDLHDGPVQDLAGISYTLSAAGDRSGKSSTDELGAALRAGAEATRRGMRQLRSMLVDIYPPNLQTAGLEASLRDLLAPLHARGVDGTLEVSDGISLAPEQERLVFRTAQEALRNVLTHAHAGRVDVRLLAQNSHVRLLVEDDGLGVSPALMEQRRAEGHIGLSLLADLAADLGATLRVHPGRERGTRVTLEVKSV